MVTKKLPIFILFEKMILPIPFLVLVISIGTWAGDEIPEKSKDPPKHKVQEEPEHKVCGSGPAICDPKEEFRPFDGSCNNLRRPSWGSKGALYSTLLKPRYEDGKS